ARGRRGAFEIAEERLLEATPLLHEEARQIEYAVVTGQMIVATETVLFAVFGEPVDEQIPVAPVADRARGHPLQPFHIAPRGDDRPVVALGDAGATDHQTLAAHRPPTPA